MFLPEEYCTANGIKLFYEKRGEGKPLLLLHGNGETHEIFDKLSKRLSEKYTVFCPDSRGHGKSSAVKEFDYNSMAEDIVGLIKALEIQKCILYGFSDGGIIGLIIAIKYPDLISGLIISGANVSPNGIKTFYLNYYKFINYFARSSLYRLMLNQPYINISELNTINIPVLVTAGQNDMIKIKHTKMIAESIKGSELIILSKENHGSYIINSNKMCDIINDFAVRRLI